MVKNIRTVEEIAAINAERVANGWKPVISHAGDCYAVVAVKLYLDCDAGRCELDRVADVAYFAAQGEAVAMAAKLTAESGSDSHAGQGDACFFDKSAYVVDCRDCSAFAPEP